MYVCIAQAMHYASVHAKNPSQEEIEAMIEEIDADGSGDIDFNGTSNGQTSERG